MDEQAGYFQEDLYSFLGHEIRVKTNSQDISGFIRSVYGRFYIGNDEHNSNQCIGAMNGDKNVITITDKLSASKELIIHGIFDDFRLKCKNLNAFDDSYYAIAPNPLAFVQWIILNNIYLLAKDYQLIHAGAVSLDNECAIFPAFSGMGKTTLTVKLVTNGFKFLSDEIACLRPDTTVVEPFHRTLRFDDTSCRLLHLPTLPDTCRHQTGEGEIEWTMDIEDIVPSSLSGPSSLRRIIFLQGFGEKPRLQHIATSNALFKLFNFSFNPLDNCAKLLYTYAPLVDRVDCFNLVVGDPGETADLIRQHFFENRECTGGAHYMIRKVHLDTALEIWSEKREKTASVFSGNSMAPLIRHGDTVIIEYGRHSFRSGDIVVFRGTDKICAHRLIRIQTKGDGPQFFLKGDNCTSFDPLVAEKHIIGKIIEVRGVNGRLRFDTTFWKLTNDLLASLSAVSAKCHNPNSKFWTLINKLSRLSSKIFLKRNSHWTILLMVISRVFRKKDENQTSEKLGIAE